MKLIRQAEDQGAISKSVLKGVVSGSLPDPETPQNENADGLSYILDHLTKSMRLNDLKTTLCRNVQNMANKYYY